MALPEHQRTEHGNFRKERSDSLARNLAKDYPEFKNVDPRTELGTLRERFGVNSINEVRAQLRKSDGK